MKQRVFGKLGITGSAMGVGCMRFPMKNVDGKNVVDQEIANQLVHTAIEGGVNYFDTAYVYSDRQNEAALGRALAGGWRERVMIATKLPVGYCNTVEDMERIFGEQLAALQTDYIDFYLVHALNRGGWDKMKGLGVREFLDRLKAEGKIRYACFSFHDGYDAFEYILNDYDWDMCQLQFNFMDTENQAGLKGVELAGEKGIPVVVMEGLLGGKLASAPDNVQALYDAFPVKRTPAAWAYRWVANFPQVAVVLSGVSDMAQLEENLKIFDDAAPGCMSEEELSLIGSVRKAYESRTKIGCTGCRYCMPCPGNVDIPGVFRAWNSAFQYSSDVKGSWGYAHLIREGHDASKCLKCRRCEKLCPQQLSIVDALKTADEEMRG